VQACRRQRIAPTPLFLLVSVNEQSMFLMQSTGFARQGCTSCRFQLRKRFLISTSRFGTGQIADSNQTPLGLHRVAQKIGGGYPLGTVFRGRRPIGLTWQGLPYASIVHRLLWLEGLESGWNRGGNTDSFRRYIYIHGFGDEMTLGRPFSHGCIHVAMSELILLYDLLPVGTLVWISQD